MLNKLGQFEEAVGYLRQALELKTDVPEFYLGLGTALMKLGQWSEAEECFERLIQFSPDSLPLSEEARQVHGASIINFSTAEAYSYLGAAKSGQGQWSEAVELYRRGLELNPGGVDCCFGLAEALG